MGGSSTLLQLEWCVSNPTVSQRLTLSGNVQRLTVRKILGGLTTECGITFHWSMDAEISASAPARKVFAWFDDRSISP